MDLDGPSIPIPCLVTTQIFFFKPKCVWASRVQLLGLPWEQHSAADLILLAARVWSPCCCCLQRPEVQS